jgi:hypothetical protein
MKRFDGMLILLVALLRQFRHNQDRPTTRASRLHLKHRTER